MNNPAYMNEQEHVENAVRVFREWHSGAARHLPEWMNELAVLYANGVMAFRDVDYLVDFVWGAYKYHMERKK